MNFFHAVSVFSLALLDGLRTTDTRAGSRKVLLVTR